MEMKALFPKLIWGFFLGLIGLVFGFIGGELFAVIGIAPTIPWTAIFTFLGGLVGFLAGWIGLE